MHELTEAWIRKAERDLGTAVREMAIQEDPNHEAVCLHAHLCVECYLKARLQEMDVPFPETRHLVVLLHLCLDVEPEWEDLKEPLRTLTHYGFRLGDPEAGLGEEEAQASLATAREFRSRARSTLGLD